MSVRMVVIVHTSIYMVSFFYVVGYGASHNWSRDRRRDAQLVRETLTQQLEEKY